MGRRSDNIEDQRGMPVGRGAVVGGGIGTIVLVPRILESVSIPVLASGGIGNGRGLAAALAMGAGGIEMGTRFVATAECIAHENYKAALVEARETDTTIIERSIGTPGRVLKSAVADRIIELENAGERDAVIASISGKINQQGAIEGRLDDGWVWSGQVAGLIHDVPTVKELLDRMVSDAERLIQDAASSFSSERIDSDRA